MKALRNAWQRWQRLPVAVQNQRLVLALLAMALLCGGGVYLLNKAAEREQGQLRKLQLKDKHSSSAPAAALPLPAGRNLIELNQSKAALEAELASAASRAQQLNARLAPNGDLASHQSLKEELTRLAAQSDLELTQLEDSGLSQEERAAPPDKARWDKLAANQHQRPLVHFRARASYRGLMQFLDGLKTLPYLVAPVSFAVKVQLGEDGGQQLQWLDVSMDLSL